MSQTENAEAKAAPAERTTDRIARWLTLGANIGVVLGLVMLIVEIQQNEALTRVATEGSMNELMAETEFHVGQPDQSAAWVRSYMTPEMMTDVDIRMNEAVLVSMLMQWDYAFQMERAGLRTRSEVERLIRNTAPFYFGTRFGKRWFAAQESGWQGTDMFEVAQPIVAAVDENFMRDYYTALRVTPEPATPPAPRPH
jgi:hypothetical protein